MTKSLEKALEAVRQLPANRQDELAEVISVAAQTQTSEYTSDQLASIDEGLKDAAAGNFVDDKKVANLFARFKAA